MIFGGLLAGLGSSLITKLVEDKGEDLVLAGVNKVMGTNLKKYDKISPEMKKEILANEYKLRELDFKELELEYRNTDSARKMQEAALAQDDVFSKRFVYYLALFWSVVAVTYIFAITFVTIPENGVRFADTILGFLLGTIIATIMNYFFGSSKGSKDKHTSMQHLLKTTP